MWRTIWPDSDTLCTCSLGTLITWNDFLPPCANEEEENLWDELRSILLHRTAVDTTIITTEGCIDFCTLLELSDSNFPISILTPYECALNASNIVGIANAYLDVNIKTQGFIKHIMNKTRNTYGYEHCRAVFFPRSGDYKSEYIDELINT